MFLLAVHLFHFHVFDFAQRLDHVTHQFLGRRGAGGHPDPLLSGDPPRVDLVGAVDEVGLDALPLGQLFTSLCVLVIAMAAPTPLSLPRLGTITWKSTLWAVVGLLAWLVPLVLAS